MAAPFDDYLAALHRELDAGLQDQRARAASYGVVAALVAAAVATTCATALGDGSDPGPGRGLSALTASMSVVLTVLTVIVSIGFALDPNARAEAAIQASMTPVDFDRHLLEEKAFYYYYNESRFSIARRLLYSALAVGLVSAIASGVLLLNT